MACGFRKLWLKRNKWVFEGKFESPKAILTPARSDLEEFMKANEKTSEPSAGAVVVNRDTRWQRPRSNTYKANWDAAFDVKKMKMAAGMVMRDSEVELIASLSMPKFYVGSAKLAEIHALWRYVAFCSEVGLDAVTFEGDALSVIREGQHLEENLAWHGQMIEDIKQVLSERPNWKIQYVPREGNRATHKLARFALQYEEEIVWIEEGPN
ncbi:hypothetical protein F2P56_021090 [Juglans regia]|uniref:Uncharacterized protein LOC109001823 n=2 Tax=Juglans regia TaxID=51240 RepID=A0A2I4FT29_JUGRE|nr:uncharacterized protein LOC109001823 [Juglans regia]KAF5456943.1 hypothetical protein F2P56_021090 [Juglans regia]